MAERKHVIEGLFTETADGPRLVGSKCNGCDAAFIPRTGICNNPECRDTTTEDAHFGPMGTVWSLAIQDYPPPAPVKYDEPYKPYAMAFVDLDDGLRILGRIDTEDPHSVSPGIRVELILDALAHEEDGTEITGWKFRPV